LLTHHVNGRKREREREWELLRREAAVRTEGLGQL
jgi:hypothetical protein